jgi:threonine/homoserine/homoserine lactone efflux protein
VALTPIHSKFIHSNQPLLPQMGVLALTHLLIALAVLTVYGSLAGRMSRFAQTPKFGRYLNFTSGALLLTAVAGLAMIRRSAD